MLMKNNEIYNFATRLQEEFQDSTQKLPVKVNFYLQKNKNTLLALGQDIEKARQEIVQNYGVLNEETQQFSVPQDKIADAAKELEELFNLEQEVQIYTVDIDNFSDDISLTTGQMEAIMFMIN